MHAHAYHTGMEKTLFRFPTLKSTLYLEPESFCGQTRRGRGKLEVRFEIRTSAMLERCVALLSSAEDMSTRAADVPFAQARLRQPFSIKQVTHDFPPANVPGCCFR